MKLFKFINLLSQNTDYGVSENEEGIKSVLKNVF